MRRLCILSIAVLFVGLFADRSFAQTSGIGLEPSSVEIELYPGQTHTTGFLIKTPSSLLLRGRLLLSLADSEIDKQGIVVFKEPDTLKSSASSWIKVHPTAVTMVSELVELIRVTVRIPEDAAPGLYWSVVLVEERPTGTPSKLDRALTPKFFYPFTIFVNVRPAPPNYGIELSSSR